MEDRPTLQPATTDDVYSIVGMDEDQEPVKTEPIIVLEEIVEGMDQMIPGESDDSDPASDRSKRKVVGKEGRVLCHLCKKVYKNRNSLATHLRAKHKLCGNTRAKMPCLEAGCTFRANRIARLIAHLIKAHNMKFQCEKVTFQKKDGKTL